MRTPLQCFFITKSFFMFNKTLKKINGVAMGFPLGPAIAKMFYVQF